MLFFLENREFSFALENNCTHLGLCGETRESGGVIRQNKEQTGIAASEVTERTFLELEKGLLKFSVNWKAKELQG